MVTPANSAHYSTTPDHVAVVVLKGVVTENDVHAYINNIRHKLATHEKVGIVVDLTEWTDMTEDALHEDLKFELSLLGELHRFPRISVVSNKQIVAALIKMAGPMMPSDIRMFAPGEEQSALAFATSIEEPKKAQHSAFTPISTHRPTLLAFEIDGTATTEDVKRVSARMLETFEQFDRIDLLVRIKEYGFDPEILNMDSWMAMKSQSFRHVRRYAVVGCKDWMKTIINAVNVFTNMDIRTFDLNEEHLAWAWLGEEPPSRQKSSESSS